MNNIKLNSETIAQKCCNIAKIYGTRYQIEIMQIGNWSSDLLSYDWHASLEFWFSKSFYRGRRDEISEKFMERSLKVLNNIEKNRLFAISKEELSTVLLSAEVNNQIDREMVIQSLQYIFKLPQHNLALYSARMIEDGKTQQVFSELQSIFGIGPKLASFYLRDLCFVYKLEPEDKEQLLCLQPTDTWVKQVSVKLQIPDCTKEKSVDEIVGPVVDFCMKNQISPLLFNAGAWYVGARSFDLLLELI